MKRKISGRVAQAAAPTAVLLALTACLAGCKGAVVTMAGSSAAATVTGGSATPAATGSAGTQDTSGTPAPAAAQDDGTASGPGSVTASVTSPATASGTVAVPVSCAAGIVYRATASSVVVQGDQLSYSVDIPRYHGPGSYQAVVGVTLHQASGVITAVAGEPKVPAVITASGGSFTVSATGSGGRTFTGSLSWTCGT